LFSRSQIFRSHFFLTEIANIRGSVTRIDMPSGRSLYQRRPERYAREKKHFQRLIYKLKRVAPKRGYTKNHIAAQLGVSNTCIYQWWAGYSLSAKRRTIERLKKFLSVQ